MVQNLDFLTNSNELSHLSVNDCNQLSDVTVLKHFKNLATVHIANCQLIQNFSFLKDLQNLKSFRYTSIWTRQRLDFSDLGGSKGLKILEINGCTTDNISFLQHLENLTELTLKKIDGALLLTQYLRCWNSLEHLDLSSSSVMDLGFLSYCQNLKTLKLSKSGLLPGHYHHITHCKKLENLDLSLFFTEILSSLIFLQNCKNLKTLDLSSTKIQDYTALKELKELRILKLSKCKFFDSNGMPCHNIDLSFLKFLKKLEEVELAGLGFDENAQNRLKAEYPDIKFSF